MLPEPLLRPDRNRRSTQSARRQSGPNRSDRLIPQLRWHPAAYLILDFFGLKCRFGRWLFDLRREAPTKESPMRGINYWTVLVAAFAAFVMSSLYYSPLVLGSVWRTVDPAAAAGTSPSIGKGVAEFARTLVITYVLARLIALLGNGNWKSAISLAVWLWFGFSAMMWVGAVMWEKTPWQIAAIHSGDWLLKTLLIAAIIGAWRRSRVVMAH